MVVTPGAWKQEQNIILPGTVTSLMDQSAGEKHFLEDPVKLFLYVLVHVYLVMTTPSG